MNILGLKINLLVASVFMLSTLAMTEVFKIKVIKKFKNDIFKVLLSWAIAVPCFFLVSLLWGLKISPQNGVKFAFLTLVLNGGYKVLFFLYKKGRKWIV